MLGILEKDPGRALPSLARLPPRVLQRRPVILLFIASLFVAGLLVTSGRLGDSCDDGSYCSFSVLRYKFSAQHQRHAKDGASARPRESAETECANFLNTSKVLLVMKTGASEAYGKVPNQILTNLKCLPDFLVFSDMAQMLASHTIRDSLDTVLPEVKNNDFELYLRQQSCPVDQESCNKFHNVGQEAWNLDKYKNIHMAEKTYALRPEFDWYLFVDADTYIMWPSLMAWLKKLNPHELHYIGSVAYVSNFPFAHGGSGYLVSQATMSKFFGGQTDVANQWDEKISHACCGDYMFSYALKATTDIAVKHAWPTVNGEKPHTFPYGKEQWCHPIVTMHHANTEEVSDLWAFDRERNFSHPVRIKDLYHRFVKEKLTATRDDWDNLSDKVFYYLNRLAYHYSDSEVGRAKTQGLSDLKKVAHQSFDDCRRACESIDSCFQYRLRNGICALSDTIKHGYPTKKEEEKQWQYQSGWNLKRIEEWVATHDKCGPVEFPIKDSWLS